LIRARLPPNAHFEASTLAEPAKTLAGLTLLARKPDKVQDTGGHRRFLSGGAMNGTATPTAVTEGRAA
jgi:hypothetical protein